MVLIYRLIYIETSILISGLSLLTKYPFNPLLRLWLPGTPPSQDPVTS